MNRTGWLLLFVLLAGLFAACKSGEDEDGDGDSTLSVQSINLTLLGRYSNDLFDSGGAEIPAYDPASRRLFVVNLNDQSVDIISIANPALPVLVSQIDVSIHGGGTVPNGSANSVAVRNGVLAVAIENTVTTDPGEVAFFNCATGAFISKVTVGALPDMLLFSPDGSRVLVANEGEPSDDYTIDPEGSISIINVSGGFAGLTLANVQTATFTGFNAQKASLIAAGVRIFGPESTVDEPDDIATVAQDLEPEYVTVTSDNATAYCVCQEANALAVINIATATVSAILPFGTKDHNLPGFGLDGSNQDAQAFIANWPVRGMYQPDAIKVFSIGGVNYLFTANEGDVRDYTGFSEETDVRNAGYVLDTDNFSASESTFLKGDLAIGRLKTSSAARVSGDTDSDTTFNQIHCFGGRSFSIWTVGGASLTRVFDSGDELEVRTAQAYPANFNASNTNNTLDNRSDDKGPEPEAVEVAQIGDRYFAFIGLERVGGVMVYDVTDPANATFVQYVNNRNFAQTPAAGMGGDLGPEGLIYIPANQSPNGQPLIVIANEISGSTTIYQIDVVTN